MSRKLARFNDHSKYGKRHRPGEMNATETAYANELEGRRLNGEIVAWNFESHTFKLAEGCRYTPDFEVLLADMTIEYVDAKGGGPMDEKSRVKVKCAAEKFWWFRFAIVKRVAKKSGGGFSREEF